MKKRLLASLLVLCMVLALGLTACTGNTNATTTTAAEEETTTAAAEETTAAAEEETTAAEGEEETTAAEAEAPATWENLSWEKDTSPVTFTITFDWDWWGNDVYGEDATSKKITELTGVTLDMTKNSDPQILSVQLAAQELNDIVFMDNLPQRFENEDVSYAWDVLIPEYCPEFWDLVDGLEKINNQAADGHVYTFKTHYNDERAYNDDLSIGNFGNFTVAYRADVMDKLGLPMFTTVEEFEETLYAVKEHASEVGITMIYNPHPSWSYLLAYWMGCPGNNMWDAETKSIKRPYTNENWLEYYKLMNKWYRDGILVKDYLGVRPEDFFARNKSGEVFVACYNAGYGYSVDNDWRETDFGGKFDDLSKPFFDQVVGHLTYKGEQRTQIYDYGTGWASTFITTNCKEPGRAICFMEFMKSPFGDKLSQWGVEGVTYTMTEDGHKMDIPGNENLSADEKKALHQTYYIQGSGWCEGISWAAAAYNAKDEWVKYGAEKGNETRLINKKLAHENKNPCMSFARVEADDDEMAMYTKINDLWSTQTAAMIVADSEAQVEEIWNKLQADMEAAGLPAVEAKMTERYIANLARYQAAGYFTDITVD